MYDLYFCFSCLTNLPVGQEAVDWMMANLNLKGREEAVIIGMGLMHRGIIKHVCNSEPFADHYFFYRFVEVRCASFIFSLCPLASLFAVIG